MTVTEFIVKFLKSKGISCVFELSGGMIMQLIDSIHLDGTIKLVTVHHEQTSSFAADAVGRMTGIPGVAIATSGPGATNLLTGIGSCYFDSSPAIFITGQVNIKEQKNDKNIRQLGFQETDIVSMVKPITKFAYKITSAGQIPEYLEMAYNIATSGRPGPVVIDIPMDVFRANIDGDIYKEEKIATSNFDINSKAVEELIDDLKKAQRPLILAGGGINSSGTLLEFREIVKELKIPVVYSLLGVDILSSDDEFKVGMIGTYGNRWSNISLYNSDCVLVLGSRLDIRQTGADTVSFKANKTIYHVDCEPEEINNRVIGCKPIIADLKEFIPLFHEKIKNYSFEAKQDWLEKISTLKATWPDTNELQNIKGINPNVFMHALSNSDIDFSAYAVDVGQHQMWAAQSIDIKPNQRFLTSGGMGAMGFALPAGIGASICTPGKPVCVIAGDAGFQLNIQELQTIVRNNLPIKIIVINNNCHGMTRQFQETYFKERYQSTIWGYSAPDFTKVAQAYGIDSETIYNESEIDSSLKNMVSSSKPFLLQVMIDAFTNVYPKLAFGLPMSEMEPFAKPMEMEST
ncbi:MAG: thiamine pyrophosphate-binding protein [Bacteroidota bacterium]